uniref:Merozoite surface antigen 1 n=1 Tax=Babesia bovis TaxID=5865 RepID=A6YQP7_BABBO|nr:merozoite surface antigen 1 [Babesia bovis]
MATFALFISALCCVSAIASSAEEVIQQESSSVVRDAALPSGYLYEDMAKFYGAVESFDKNKLFAVISANFEAAKVQDKVNDAFKHLYIVNAMIKRNPMIRSDLFNEAAVSIFSQKTDEEKFNAIFESIKAMYRRIDHMDKYLKTLRWNNDIAEEDREKAEDYFKKHVYKDEHEINVNGMAGVCKGFLNQESEFYKLAESFDAFDKGKYHGRIDNFAEPKNNVEAPKELVSAIEEAVAKIKAPTNPENTELPAQAAPGASEPTSPGGQPTAPAAPQPGASATEPAQEPAPSTKPEQPAGNLSGQQGSPKPASFTFGGLTVATLCYFVLSAF